MWTRWPPFEARGEIRGRVDGGDLALINDDHAIAGHADFRKNVRGKNDGVISGETFDQVAHFDDLLGIEADGWFIENDYIGIVDQGLGDSYALLIAAGEALDELVALVFEAGFFDGVLDAGFAFIGGDIFDARDEIEIRVHGHVRIERRIFWEITDAAADFDRIGVDIVAGYAGGAAGGGHEARQDAHRGGFAGAVGAEKTEDFAFIYFEGDMIDRGFVAERFR